MSLLPDDISFLILYIIPGFIFLKLYSKIKVISEKIDEVHLVIYSLIISSVIFSPFVFYFRIKTFDEARSFFFHFESLFAIIIISIITSISVGYIAKKVFSPDIREGNVWDLSFNTAMEEIAFIDVYLKNGEEYISNEFLISQGDSKHEILLKNARLIKRNDDNEVIENKVIDGHVYIKESEMKKIIFIKPDENIKERNGMNGECKAEGEKRNKEFQLEMLKIQMRRQYINSTYYVLLSVVVSMFVSFGVTFLGSGLAGGDYVYSIIGVIFLVFLYPIIYLLSRFYSSEKAKNIADEEIRKDLDEIYEKYL